MKNKEILEEMKQYFKLSSIEDVAVKLGYKEATASTWRSRGVSKAVLNKFELMKSNDLINDIETVERALSNKNDTVFVNYYPDIYAAAGYGSINEYGLEPELMTFDRKFLQELLNVRSIKSLDIIRVAGDSMEPFIHNGEYVILERSHEAFNGETVIANIHGQVYIKRYLADPFKKWIKLVSDNEIYGDINLDTQEHIEALSIVGIVRAKIKPF